MVSRLVLVAVLASCGGGRSGPDAGPDADDRDLICERTGTSSITGTGPHGPLDGSFLYASVLNGFCGNTLALDISPDDPLVYPAHPDSARAFVTAPGLGDPAPEWSGSFDIEFESPDEVTLATGTLDVERGSPSFVKPTFIRGTLKVTGTWQLDATFDMPYCLVTTCL